MTTEPVERNGDEEVEDLEPEPGGTSSEPQTVNGSQD
jgi:hypothetical protein